MNEATLGWCIVTSGDLEVSELGPLVFNVFIDSLDTGQNASPACLLTTLNWEILLSPWRALQRDLDPLERCDQQQREVQHK